MQLEVQIRDIFGMHNIVAVLL